MTAAVAAPDLRHLLGEVEERIQRVGVCLVPVRVESPAEECGEIGARDGPEEVPLAQLPERPRRVGVMSARSRVLEPAKT
jgi:hypothetical protein